MAPNPSIINAVENLGYRVSSGDVAAKAGIDVNVAQRELLALASEAGGHLQVAESGDIAFEFPRNFKGILRNKYWRLKLQDWWQKVWRVLFYLIRISFGIVLILSIVLIVVAISAILIVISSNSDNDSSGGSDGGGGGGFIPIAWLWPDWWWFVSWDDNYYQRQDLASSPKNRMNFLESIFSFLFGDGNPNYNLEERRWQSIGTVIRNNRGAIIAEQITPYLDDLGSGADQEFEDYMLPVLARFDGRPEVTQEGQFVYHFPQLQTTAQESHAEPVTAYLKERPRRFTLASSGQVMGAIGLGAVNLIGALMLGSLLKTPAIASYLTGFLGFVQIVYPILLAYGIGFLVIPLIRYFWVQWRNQKIETRNEMRQERVILLNQANPVIQEKLNYAREFATETVISKDNLAYTTETNLIEQEEKNSAKIDAEWQKRLDRSSGE